ncbi:dihydrofolate reductase family protein [Variovorax sp. GB1P17]|uniref:dihydrofolate reductase family protein n=1 Tax=Variovorax sp. GB1P17 TaxID=3443740 RepID=UPI003F4754D8
MKVKVLCFGVSLDGYAAGPNQDLQNPLGVGGPAIFDWFFPTQVFQRMHGASQTGETGVDNQIAERAFENIGAWILGRNMFGPVRGPWPDESWKGWWGDEPPYHVPTFVLTHHARPVLHMKGGTDFHFVTDGMASALAQAKAAAGERDIRIGGGAATVRQFLQARVVDELHLAVRPVLMGAGESLWHGLDMRALGYEVAEVIQGERATHVMVRKQA